MDQPAFQDQIGNPGVPRPLLPGIPAVLSLPNAVSRTSDQELSSPCLTPILAESVPKAAPRADGLDCRGVVGAGCLGLTLEGPTLLLFGPLMPLRPALLQAALGPLPLAHAQAGVGGEPSPQE